MFSSELRSWLILVVFSVVVACTEERAAPPGPGEPSISLTSLPSTETGIDFNNSLDESGNLNVFIWNFLYTGAGVAVGDISGDGLPDIYFAGNQISDRLYLNKGDFQFEDITARSGIDGSGWSTGVTMADVNGDGLLDIYVCKNSPTAIVRNNVNKLFINQGSNTFIEKAAEYGLDDMGFSVQANFFDLENDGDLDMYLANQPFDQFARLVNPPEQVARYPETDRLFIQENGRFRDVTDDLNLRNARYGLHVALTDVNVDGWTDLYVCNDYHHADHLYINRNGRLTDEIKERTGHISFYSMGGDVGDINNDGWPDICVLDMAFDDHYRAKTNMESMQPERFWQLVNAGQHYPYAQNTLQLNRGYGYFSDVAQVCGVAKTDWSGAPLFADLDHDGHQDLLVTNGILRDMKNNDFNDWVKRQFGGAVGPHNVRDVMQQLPSVPVDNRVYQNHGNLNFSNISAESGFGFTGFSHGMAYGDLDQDGDLDFVVNNMNAEAGIYKNTSGSMGNYLIIELEGAGNNRQALGATVTVNFNNTSQINTMQTTRGFMSSCEPILHFGLGDSPRVDSIEVLWNHRERTVIRDVEANQRLVIDYSTEDIRPFEPKRADGVHLRDAANVGRPHREFPFDDYADQVLLPYKLSENGPFVAVGDVNGDGLEDVWVGGAAGQAGLVLLHNHNHQFTPISQTAFEADAPFEDMQGALFDADSDGDLDLYVVSGSNEHGENSPLLLDRFYENDGSGTFTRVHDALPADLLINGQCVEPFDLEGDGDLDLFIGGRLVAGRYPIPPGSAVLINHAGRFSDASEKVAPYLQSLGLVTDAVADDIDNDGDQDLIVVGEWMEPIVMINNKGSLAIEDYSVNKNDSTNLTGIWWSIEKGDFDNDGDNDFLLGNLGWNNKFGGRQAHLMVYAGDLDGNGDHDVVLAKEKGGHVLPVRGRECSSEEMPVILTRFPSYDAFGKAELPQILPDLESVADVQSAIGTFASVLLRNDGNMQFTVIELPLECQLGPVKGFAASDFNNDGHLDFAYVGNHYPVEVETARYDGLISGICFGNGENAFNHQPLLSDGEIITGDARAVTPIPSLQGLLITFNSQSQRLVLLP